MRVTRPAIGAAPTASSTPAPENSVSETPVATPSASPAARSLADELRRTASTPVQLGSMPAAAPAGGSNDPMAVAGVQVVEPPRPPTAAEMARADVEVSDVAVRAERDAAIAEAHAAVVQVREDAEALLARARTLADEPGAQVQVEEGRCRVQLADASGRPTSFFEVRVEPGKTEILQIERQGEVWIEQERRAVNGGEAACRFESTLRTLPVNQDNPSPLEDGLLRRARASEERGFEVVVDGKDVEREEWVKRNDDLKGRRDFKQRAKQSFVEHEPGALKLPGDIERGFDSKLPVIERTASVTEERNNARDKALLSERVFSQGSARVVETTSGSNRSLLLEREVEAGRRKEIQQFFRGSERTVRTTVEVVGEGAVRETQTLYDSNDDQVSDPDTRAQKLKTTQTDRRYGEDGRIISEERTTVDAVSGEQRREAFERVRDGDQLIEDMSVESVAADGKRSVSTAREVSQRRPEGEFLESLSLRQGTRTLELKVEGDSINYVATDLEKNTAVTGTLTSGGSDKPMTLKVNGKRVEVPADPKAAAKLLRERLSPEEMVGLDVAFTEAAEKRAFLRWLVTGEADDVEDRVRWGMNLWDRYELAVDTFDFARDQYNRIKTLIDRISTGSPVVPVINEPRDVDLWDQLDTAIGFVSVALEARRALRDLKRGDHLRAGLRAVRGTSQAVQLGGELFGYFAAASVVGRGLRAGRAAIDLVQGSMAVSKGDTRFDRINGGARIATSATRVGLALTASAGPLAPFLFGSLIAFEGIKFAASVADRRYVAPLVDELAS